MHTLPQNQQKNPLTVIGRQIRSNKGATVACVEDLGYLDMLAKAPAMAAAIKVIVFTEAHYAHLMANDPQALKQLLSCFTLGEITTPQAEFLGNMCQKYGGSPS